MKIITRSDLLNLEDERKRARLVNCLSATKPAFLIGTQSNQETSNLAIFSNIIHLGSHPPLIGILFRPENARQHTYKNILENSLLTLNLVSEDFVEKAHQSSARYDESQSEFEEVSLTEEWINNFKAPFVKESKLKVALKLLRFMPISENGTQLMIGEIEFACMPESSLREDGSIDIASLKAVSAVGLDSYHQAPLIKRLSYAKADREISEL